MRLLLALAALLLAPCAAHAGLAAQGDPDPAAVQVQAGVRLPEQLCGLVRRQLVPYAGGLRADYQLPGRGIVTIYVTPIADSVASEFAATEQIIGRLHANLTPIRDLAGPPGVSGEVGRIWRRDLPAGLVVSGLLLWDHAGWRIKLRGTVDAALADAGWREIECAIRSLPAPAAA